MARWTARPLLLALAKTSVKSDCKNLAFEIQHGLEIAIEAWLYVLIKAVQATQVCLVPQQ